MLTLNKTHQSLLESYSRPIVHLRRQVLDHRFGLVFGAGLSKHWGIPTWGELVGCIAEDPEVQGNALLKMVPPRAGLPYKTEMLFEHFKQRRYAKAPLQEHNTRQLDFRIGADWREIVRQYLYGGTKDGIGKPLSSHPYLKEYLPLIQQSQ